MLLSLAMIGLFAVTAKAESYAVESTNSWFTANLESVSKNRWSNPGSSSSLSGIITIDTASDSPLLFEPPAATDDCYRVVGTITMVRNATAFVGERPVYNAKPALGALAVADTSWYGVTGTVWTTLSGVDVPEDDTTNYDVMMEFWTNSTPAKVRYSVKVDDAFVALTNSAGVSKLPVAGDITTVSNIGFAGYGKISALNGMTFSSFTITVSYATLNAMGISTNEASVAQITEALNSQGANGLTKWESIVLGLPNPATKPYIAPAQNATTNTIAFTYGNFNPPKSTGASVVFDVYSMDEVGGATSFATNSVNGVAEVPADSTNVKYYKVKIRITE